MLKQRQPFKHGPEELEMFAFFDACKVLAHVHPAYALAWHVPNERKASIRRRVSMARAGVKKGVPDITIPVPNKHHAGLYIEMKVKPNKPSPEQLELIAALKKAGNYALVCYSAEEALGVLGRYIKNEI